MYQRKIIFILFLSFISSGFFLRTAISQNKENDFVDIVSLDPNIHVEMMYATSSNFLGRPVAGYQANICYLRKEAAQALMKADERLQLKAKERGQNLVLVVYDCYRPEKAVKDFVSWANDPAHVEMKQKYYPNMAKPDLISLNYISPVSGHTRGSSVDLTIAEILPDKSLKELPMGTIVDFFGDRANTAYPNLTQEEKILVLC